MRTKQKNSTDWQEIRRLWQENAQSVRALARLFSVDEKTIRKRAKLENWQKSAGPQSAGADHGIEGNTAGKASENGHPDDLGLLVKAAAEWDVDVLAIKSLAVIAKLAHELDRVSDNAELLEQIVIEETAGDKSPKRRQLLTKILSLPTRLQGARNMASAFSIIVGHGPGKKDQAKAKAERVAGGDSEWGDLLDPYARSRTQGDKPWKN